MSGLWNGSHKSSYGHYLGSDALANTKLNLKKVLITIETRPLRCFGRSQAIVTTADLLVLFRTAPSRTETTLNVEVNRTELSRQ
jgi:hypothetical protein